MIVKNASLGQQETLGQKFVTNFRDVQCAGGRIASGNFLVLTHFEMRSSSCDFIRKRASLRSHPMYPPPKLHQGRHLGTYSHPCCKKSRKEILTFLPILRWKFAPEIPYWERTITPLPHVSATWATQGAQAEPEHSATRALIRILVARKHPDHSLEIRRWISGPIIKNWPFLIACPDTGLFCCFFFQDPMTYKDPDRSPSR